MKRILIYLLLSGCFLLYSGWPSNAFEYESWPFEGMPYFRIKVDTLVLLKNPELKSEVAIRLPVRKGSIITFPFGVKELVNRFKEYGKAYGIEKVDLINRKLILKQSIQKSIKPGIIRALKTETFSGYVRGKDDKIIKSSKESKEQSFTFKKGDIIEDLLYLGEGVCLIRFNKKIIQQETCLHSEIADGFLKRESSPITEWWVIVAKDNKNLGWINLDDKPDMPLEFIEAIY